MQHQKPLMIHQYQMQQVEEKNLQQTSHEEIQVTAAMDSRCQLQTCNRSKKQLGDQGKVPHLYNLRL
jgi:hypothetical protein